MSRTPHSTLSDPDQTIANLKRQLAECKAELDQRTAERDALQRELVDAGEQQTATAEVLQVINSSPGDLASVFDALLEKAARLCDAGFGILWTYDGERFHAAALHGVPSAFAEFARNPISVADSAALGDIVRGHEFVHVTDLAASENYTDSPLRCATVDLGGARTGVAVPLRKDSSILGIFVIYRQEVRAFSHKQIALLQNFAAQTVIAMENARLITETREALEQQTATAEVLQVINSSPGDLAPVFDAMLDKAMRLCGAAFGFMTVIDGERSRTVAARGVPAGYAAFRERNPTPANAPIASRVRKGEPFIQTVDLKAERFYREGDPQRRAIVDLGGARTLLAVPLMRDQAVLGAIQVYRTEVRPFTEKQIALLQNFAAQAVIAMENARLLTETREALDQQTATAEVLQVVSSSPGDVTPVFDAMLEKALVLCDASFGQLVTFDGVYFRAAAWREYEPGPNATTPTPGMALYDLVDGAHVVHIADITADDVYRSGNVTRRRLADEYGARTAIWVALRKEAALLGAFVIYRTEVRPFSDKQIALLQNFAAQAVIAIENARLINEIHQRQAELRVTFDNMGDGMAMFDDELCLAAWNRNFQEMLDLPDAFLAKRPSYAEYFHYLAERGEYGSADLEAELRRAIEDTNREMRFERTRPDGRVIEVRRNAVPDGGFVLIYSDITERKRSEAEIRAARDAAEAAYRDLKAAQASLIQAEKMASLGQLTAGIAHEIKNPLNFVNNFAGLSVELLDELKETAAPAIAALSQDKRSEIDETIGMLTGNLERIAEHGRRADGIVKSMLEHSRGMSGERREVDLNALVDEALNLAYHGARAQNASFNITLERDLDPAVAPIELAPQEITRVFLNLFGNGFYAANKRVRGNGEGVFRPTLQVSTRDLGDAVEVRVRDNGTGIPPEIRDQLFQPFFTTKPTGEGTGLGLSISYDIVTQQHGGSIEVDSEPGEFTEFTIRLPRNGQAAGRSV
jgi:two-component system NtrC family sensor kinase